MQLHRCSARLAGAASRRLFDIVLAGLIVLAGGSVKRPKWDILKEYDGGIRYSIILAWRYLSNKLEQVELLICR